MNLVSRVLGHLIACKEVTRLVSRLQERPASRLQRTRLRWHLAICDACTRFERQIALVRDAMRCYRT